jgi:D-hydroxyproline dehydrogenase subunit beta
LLSRGETLAQAPAANPDGLIGALFSRSEVGVNPRAAIRGIPSWLADTFKVAFEFETAITRVDDTTAISSSGRTWNFDRLIVCGGADFETLFPQILGHSGLKRCKLQMLRTNPQPTNWRIGPLLASGLTLRHYKNFEICPSLTELKRRIAVETPELDRYGIHVMASQTQKGSVILGDSHEYDDAIEPFDKAVIDESMLRELRSIIRLPDWTICEHWHGIYAKHPELPIFAAEPTPNVFIRFGPGGAGMTMAFGLAERDWEHWD